LQIKTKIVSCHTADSKPVKQEVNGTVILSPLVFPGSSLQSGTHKGEKKSIVTTAGNGILKWNDLFYWNCFTEWFFLLYWDSGQTLTYWPLGQAGLLYKSFSWAAALYSAKIVTSTLMNYHTLLGILGQTLGLAGFLYKSLILAAALYLAKFVTSTSMNYHNLLWILGRTLTYWPLGQSGLLYKSLSLAVALYSAKFGTSTSMNSVTLYWESQVTLGHSISCPLGPEFYNKGNHMSFFKHKRAEFAVWNIRGGFSRTFSKSLENVTETT